MGIAELLLNASLEFFAEIFNRALQRLNRARRVVYAVPRWSAVEREDPARPGARRRSAWRYRNA
jgi:hypothetical protein